MIMLYFNTSFGTTFKVKNMVCFGYSIMELRVVLGETIINTILLLIGYRQAVEWNFNTRHHWGYYNLFHDLRHTGFGEFNYLA